MRAAAVLLAAVLAVAIMGGASAEALKDEKKGAIVGQLRKLKQESLEDNLAVKDVVINLDPRYTYENIIDPATGRSFVRVTDTNMEDEELEETVLGKLWGSVANILVGALAGGGTTAETLIEEFG